MARPITTKPLRRKIVGMTALAFALIVPAAAMAAEETLKPPQVRPGSCAVTHPITVDRQNWSSFDWKAGRLDVQRAYHLGLLYSQGNGQTPPNPALAQRFFAYAAERPSLSQAPARLQLARLAIRERTPDIGPDRILKLLQLAVAGQANGALKTLGQLYEEGGLVTADPGKAAEYYRLAVRGGDGSAALALARLLKARPAPAGGADTAGGMVQVGLTLLLADVGRGQCTAMNQVAAEYMDGGLLPTDAAAAAAWFAAASRGGDVHATEMLAGFYEIEYGVPQNSGQAIALFNKAAAAGSATAMAKVAESALTGGDRTAAIAGLERSVKWGNDKAILRLADIYRGKPGEAPDTAKLIYWLERAGSLPNPIRSALLELGDIYRNGKDVPENPAKSADYFRRAAAADSAEGGVRLAESHEWGLGQPRNLDLAHREYLHAAELGSAEAMLRLADLNACGIGAAADPAEEAKWIERAASQGSSAAILRTARRLENRDQAAYAQFLRHSAELGDRRSMVLLALLAPKERAAWLEKASTPGIGREEAMVELAKAHLAGVKIGRDVKKAEELLRGSAEAGFVEAGFELGRLYLDKGGNNRAAAVAWLETAAKAGNVRAMVTLGTLHLHNRPADLAAARMWLDKAAQRMSIPAMLELAQAHAGRTWDDSSASTATALLERAESAPPCKAEDMMDLAEAFAAGWGGQPDAEKSKFWLDRSIAAEGNDPQAWAKTARILVKRMGTPQDVVQGIALYRRAAEAGNPDAMREYARALLFGTGGKTAPAEAVQWLRKAAERGHVLAMMDLANATSAGIAGPASSPAEAVQWLRKAAATGNTEAMYQLGAAYRTGYGVAADEAESQRWLKAAGGTDRKMTLNR